MTEAGFEATGIEQSRAFARLACRTAPRATIHHASLYQTSLPRCDAMTALGEVLNYLPAGSRAPVPLIEMFRRAFAALRPGGLLIFDLLVSGRALDYETARTGPDWAVLVRVNEDPKGHRLIRRITTFRRHSRHYTREDEVHILTVPARSRVLADLRRAGFVAKSARRYGGFVLPPRRAAFVARKPARLHSHGQGSAGSVRTSRRG